MTEPQSFEAQHVLITGAGSGIGRLMALGATQPRCCTCGLVGS